MATGRKAKARPEVGGGGKQFKRVAMDDVSDPSRFHWVAVKCAKHHFEFLETGKYCDCPPGPQVTAIWSPADEILQGGSRGSMKTETFYGFLLKGNGTEPQDLPVNVSYVNHPEYMALVLRKNERYLHDWYVRAKRYWEPMGAKFTERPPMIEWPSGAQFILGHLDSEDSYEKHQGSNYIRIVIDEATQLRSGDLYEKLRMSCRSKFSCMKGCRPGTCRCGYMRPQIMLAANPGGPTHTYFKKRFYDVAPLGNIYTDPRSKTTRVFIPSTVYDNPYYLHDPSQGYINSLQSIEDETLRRMWLENDWNALKGQFFKAFRTAPIGGEPPEARHVITLSEFYDKVRPWYPRFAGCDWGYQHHSAVYGFVQCPNGQILAHRELSTPETGSVELGTQIADLFMEDLRELQAAGVPAQITLWLSPDAWNKRDDFRTPAELIRFGVQQRLGPNGALLWDTDTPPAAWVDNGGPAIIIRRARNERVQAWQYIRELLRWTRVAPPPTPYDHEYAEKLRREDEKRFREYCKAYEQAEAQGKEVLPRHQIVDQNCPLLIETIPSIQYDEDKANEDMLKTQNPEDDRADAWRYGLYSQHVVVNREPGAYVIARRLEEARVAGVPIDDPNVLAQVARKAEADWKKNQAGFTKPIRLRRSCDLYGATVQ